MTRSAATLALVLLPVLLPGQTTHPPASADATVAQAKTQQSNQPLSAILMQDVDARRVKIGDPVKVRTYSGLTLAGGTRIAPGAVMTGHITQVSKLGKGSIESRLAMVFDQVQVSGGQFRAVHMGIAGLAAAPPPIEIENDSEIGASSASPFPGARSTGINVDPSNQRSTGATTGGTGGTRVTRGLPGQTNGSQIDGRNGPRINLPGDHIGAMASIGSTVPGISLSPSPADRSVLVSTSNNIELRAGTPLVLLPIADPQQ